MQPWPICAPFKTIAPAPTQTSSPMMMGAVGGIHFSNISSFSSGIVSEKRG
jgi:hypothetical protein